MNSFQCLKEQNSLFNHFMPISLKWQEKQRTKKKPTTKDKWEKPTITTSIKKYLVTKYNYLPWLKKIQNKN